MSLIVIDPGLSTTIQDGGRPGYREWGVPLGGAFDRGSAGLANALVGNMPGCAVLEMTLVGGQYRAVVPLALALAGAPLEAKVVCADATQRHVPIPSSFSLLEGESLVLGRTVAGARTYLAARSGWQRKARLGSRSSEQRLKAGEILVAASGTVGTRRPSEPTWRPPGDGQFRIIAGPDGRFYPELDHAFWSARRFQVSSQSNRMGLRLQGEPVAIAAPAERLSAPVAPGALQVAGDQLIVLGVACGTMGGYPHVAHLISADLDRLGQLRPGDTIMFCVISLEEARALDRSERQVQGELLRRVATLVEGA
jgi:biotin-dependent carboxylase-like uncharacterized protein